MTTRCRWAAVTLMCALLAACTVGEPPPEVVTDPPDGDAVGSADLAESESPGSDGVAVPADRVLTHGDWALDALDPGGRVLQVSVRYGGCEEHHGLEVEQTPDVVTLVNRLSEPVGEEEGKFVYCPLVASGERVVVVLDAPLGDRELRGCGSSDCLDVSRGEGPWAWHHLVAVADGDGVVVDDGERLASLDLNGNVRWRGELAPDERPAIGGPSVGAGSLVLREVAGRELRAYDRDDGTVRWTAPFQQSYDGIHVVEVDGRRLAVGGRPGALPEVDPGYRRHLGAVDLADGATVWDIPGPEGHVRSHHVDGETLVAVSEIQPVDPPTGTNRSAAAWTLVTGLDVADGGERWSLRLAGAPRSAVIADGVVVVQVWGSRFGIDLATGVERWRDLGSSHLGLSVHDGTVHGVDEDDTSRWILDPATGEVAPTEGRSSVLRGGLLLSTTPPGKVTATDAATGGDRWTAPLHAQVGVPALHGRLLVFATPIGAVAFDAEDGSLRWSWADEALEGPRRWE